MKQKTRKLSMLALCIAVLFALTACAAPAAPAAPDQPQQTAPAPAAPESQGAQEAAPSEAGVLDTLRIGLTTEPPNLDPLIHSGYSVRAIKWNIYRGLMYWNTEGELVCDVAESYDISEDGTVYTFKLRPNVTFHDGTPLTAEDVKFTYERLLDPASGASYSTFFTGVLQQVNAVDDLTVEFVLSQPCAPFLDYVAMHESGILCKSWVEAGHDLNTETNGCGPYKMVSWERGLELVVEAHDGYYGAPPATKNIIFQFYSDGSARTNALLSGEVDIIDFMTTNDYLQVQDQEGIETIMRSGSYMCLEFNCGEDSPFADVRVRQAIAYAVNRQGVIDAAFSGIGTVLGGFPSVVGIDGYNGEVDNYYYEDIEKAKALLAEAGYPDGFSCELLASSEYEFHEQTAVVVQDSLKRIGIECTLALPDWATRMERFGAGDFEMGVVGTMGKIIDMDWATQMYHSSDVIVMDLSPHFEDAEIDRLLDEARATTDVAKRQELYAQFRQRAMETCPIVYLNWRPQLFAYGDYIENFTVLDAGLSTQYGCSFEKIVVREH